MKNIEIVQELKIESQIPSYEEFMRNYQTDANYSDLNHNDIREVRGYGPCKSALCGCSCSSRECKCSKDILWNEGSGSSLAFHGRKREEDIDPEDWDKLKLRMMGVKDRSLSGQVSGSIFNYRDSDGELKVLSGTATGEISRNGIMGKATADLCNFKTEGVQLRVGVGIDTGISVEEGLEVKAVGFGFSVGKKTGVSMPFGEIKVDTDDCVIQ